MSLQSFKSPICVPELLTHDLWSIASMLIDATGERVAGIFEVDESGTMSKVGFLTGAVTTSQTLRVSLQTVDPATGNATGTLYGGSTAGTQAAPAANTYYLVTLGTGATAVKGDMVAVVIEFDSTVGSVNIVGLDGYSVGNTNLTSTYSRLYTTAWASADIVPTYAIEYSDGSYKSCGLIQANSITTAAFNSGSAADERALRFTVPFKCRVNGFWILGTFPTAADFDVVLYEGTTALLTKSIEGFIIKNASTGILKRKFDTSQILTPGTVYYLSVKPTTVNNVTLMEFTTLSAAMMDGWSLGQSAYLATRVDAGAWTTNTARRPQCGIMIDQLDDGIGDAMFAQSTDIFFRNQIIGY